METKTIKINETNKDIIVFLPDEEIEQNNFIPETGEDTMDLKEVLELARKIDAETFIEGMDEIID
ncbi:MAG: hypothetical protein RSB77_06325 [Bacilli bacterium]